MFIGLRATLWHQVTIGKRADMAPVKAARVGVYRLNCGIKHILLLQTAGTLNIISLHIFIRKEPQPPSYSASQFTIHIAHIAFMAIRVHSFHGLY
jgi:hypothetical protein